jgi:sulfur-oxidizing protein SoxX
VTRRGRRAALTIAILALAASWAAAQPAAALPPYQVIGDAIPQPLTETHGDAARGRAIVADRSVGLCLLCHRAPLPVELQGTLAPDLAGTGSRWSEGQLRLRIVDPRRLNPSTLMPSYYRVDGLQRVGSAWRDRPVLNPQQIEDVVAFLRTLRD